ncbi:hypothetical protein BSKO_00245 [Bryopsis sp. KO-2023]|nr:hypothetical protein BSKO_00245 [Bryopsis sp. KO-2023]
MEVRSALCGALAMAVAGLSITQLDHEAQLLRQEVLIGQHFRPRHRSVEETPKEEKEEEEEVYYDIEEEKREQDREKLPQSKKVSRIRTIKEYLKFKSQGEWGRNDCSNSKGRKKQKAKSQQEG